MLGFPVPYDEELLYSTIARAGVHDGDTSPKQLLDKVFSNRKVIATVDLPCHVQILAEQYPPSLHLSVSSLIFKHTLWPMYMPFLPKERLSKLKLWMAGSSQGAAHLASGSAASRVKSKTKFYVCPSCLKDQLAQHGEYYWKRIWQIPLVKVCPKHGPLYLTDIGFDGEHRHTFFSVENAKVLGAEEVQPNDQIFAQQVDQLTHLESKALTFSKWSSFYQQLASTYGFRTGAKIDHARILQAVVNFWGKRWLEEAGILPTNSETSWLKTLFRKHRKSFSFAEHIVAVTAISGGLVPISVAIEIASKLEGHNDAESTKSNDELSAPQSGALTLDQIHWKQILIRLSPKLARQHSPALYARLYRNHHDWLIETDDIFHTPTEIINNRVDWAQRDRLIARELKGVFEKLSEDLLAPLLSRTFLIHQLRQRAMIEKNLHRLPRCSKFLSFYSESTSEYQARRLARAWLEMQNECVDVKRWSLLRKAGLSDERMTGVVARLLKEILDEQA
ncbi:TnsD family Tn7-like transposition protein [Neiella marina]|uniref:TnsD family Tn7-like transposition protein n=1 Tax=Neiella marina TaxID=508461 RepID=UPI000B3C2BB4|nr:TnsD family Tn7-like transposition protein [Neiella marina]